MVLSLCFVGCTTNDNGYEVYKSGNTIYYLVHKTNELDRVTHAEFHERFGLTKENTKNALIDGFLLKSGTRERYDYSQYYKLIKKEDYDAKVREKEELERIRIANEKIRLEQLKKEKERIAKKNAEEEALAEHRMKLEREARKKREEDEKMAELERIKAEETEKKRLEELDKLFVEFDEFCRELQINDYEKILKEYELNKVLYERRYKGEYRTSKQVGNDLREIIDRYKKERN